MIKSAKEIATSAESRRAPAVVAPGPWITKVKIDAEAAKYVERVGIIAVASDEDDATILELDAEAHDVDDEFLVQGLLHIVALRAIDVDSTSVKPLMSKLIRSVYCSVSWRES